MMMPSIEKLVLDTKGTFQFYEKRPGIFQVITPFSHEDGDNLEIFIESLPDSPSLYRVSDYAMTLMRLSYTLDYETEARQKIIQNILDENRVQFDDGSFQIETPYETLYQSIMTMAQTVSKVSSMQYFNREVVKDLFEQDFQELVLNQFSQYHPEKNAAPVKEQDMYQADFALSKNGRPQILLFGVNNQPKARLAVMSCQHFKLKQIPFYSFGILSAPDIASKADHKRLMNTIDKQYATLQDFKHEGMQDVSRFFGEF